MDRRTVRSPTQPDVTGEVCVAGAHVKDRYDKLWATERLSSRNSGWHRTGDVGHLDTAGRLWIEGRLVHVITTADGPVTPVGIEQRVESLAEVPLAAVVGVGPAGTQQVVIVIETGSDGLADPQLTAAVRAAAGRSRRRRADHPQPAGRHPARVEDRPDPSRPMGRSAAGGGARPAVRVLVTGASGMLGAATARALAAGGRRVTVLQRRPAGLGLPEVLADVADPDAVRDAVAGQDAVIHLAAKVNVTGPWAGYERTNVGGTRAVVDACRAAGVGRLIHVSSPSVSHAGRSLVGVEAGPADPDAARGPYARSKAYAERLALAADGDDLAVVAIRPHLVWGPGRPAADRPDRRPRSSRPAAPDRSGSGAGRHDVRRQRRRRPAGGSGPGARRPWPGPGRDQRRTAARSATCSNRSAPRPAYPVRAGGSRPGWRPPPAWPRRGSGACASAAGRARTTRRSPGSSPSSCPPPTGSTSGVPARC